MTRIFTLGGSAEELTPDQYAEAIRRAYIVASLIKGLPLVELDAMINRAKLAAPLAMNDALRAQSTKFKADCIVVERLHAVFVALNALVPTLVPMKIGRPLDTLVRDGAVTGRVGDA